jgi:hypothetical protein
VPDADWASIDTLAPLLEADYQERWRDRRYREATSELYERLRSLPTSHS